MKYDFCDYYGDSYHHLMEPEALDPHLNTIYDWFKGLMQKAVHLDTAGFLRISHLKCSNHHVLEISLPDVNSPRCLNFQICIYFKYILTVLYSNTNENDN